MLYCERHILVVVVVFLPPSQRKLCVDDGLILDLLKFSIAIGLACGECARAAPHVAESFV